MNYHNPQNKTVNLSPEVYQGRSVAAAAVAAHECGHAVQHARSYQWLEMRSKLVPVVSISSNLMQYVMMAAMFGLFTFSFGKYFILAAVVFQAAIMVFALVTLPVEFDASRRALEYIDSSGIAGRTGAEYEGAKDALKQALRLMKCFQLYSNYLFIYL
ncbi:MAG: zinc metallopeptidase [Chitinophagales bacterium]